MNEHESGDEVDGENLRDEEDRDVSRDDVVEDIFDEDFFKVEKVEREGAGIAENHVAHEDEGSVFAEDDVNFVVHIKKPAENAVKGVDCFFSSLEHIEEALSIVLFEEQNSKYHPNFIDAEHCKKSC